MLMTDVYRIFEKSTRAITSDKKCYGGQAFDANTTTIHFQILDKGSDWDFIADGYRPFIVFNVYDQYGIPPRLLTSIDRISRPTINGATTTTYSYCYHNPDSVFASDIYVEVDENGRTKRIYTTK